MSVKIELSPGMIELTIPVRGFNGTNIQPDAEAVIEHHTIRRGEPVGFAIYSIAHRDPVIFARTIQQLKAQVAEAHKGNKRFIRNSVKQLQAARNALRNSTDF